jgi:hypothetical protein
MTLPLRKPALVAALLLALGCAHASTVLDFDDGLDTSQSPFAPLLTHGAPLFQHGFLIGPASSRADATAVDLAGALVNGLDIATTCGAVVCPTNNASTFLVGLDDSVVYLSEASDTGVPFTLSGFRASFVGNGIDPIPSQGGAGVIRVLGVLADGSGSRFESFVLAPASDTGVLSFSTYASSFASTPLAAAIFVAFHCDTAGVCTDAFTNNKAQFALDDIEVSAVPEAAIWQLALAGLALLRLARRRAHGI